MEEESDFLKLPVEERCQHKSWKARVSGYEEVTKSFQQLDEKSQEFSKYLGLIKKFVTDSNAAAQEKGIIAALAFAENAACAGKTCAEVVSGAIAKGLAASRTKTRELSSDLILMYIEIERQDVVQEELIKGLENKSPKVVAACITILKDALHSFGSQVVTVKPLVRILPKLLEDRDKAVREESKQLCVEVYRWVGDAIKPQFQKLKPVTLSELEGEFDKVKGERPKPTRYLKSQQEKMSKVQSSDAADGDIDDDEVDAEVIAPEIDPFDIMTPVDILSKLPKDFFEQCEAKKWQERKDALQNLLQMSTNVKLETGDYGDLVRALKKIIAKDTNVVVVALGTKCLNNLVTGLRKKFHPYVGSCIPVILEKFKEKKQNVVIPLREAIDAMYGISNLEALMEDIQAALANKNPQIKSETAAFLARCFCKCTPQDLGKKLLKPLCASLIKTLNDTDVSVRDNSAEALGTALKVTGEKVMTPFIQEIDALKMTKVKDCCEKAVITAKPQVVEKKAKVEKPVQVAEKPVPAKVPANQPCKTATFTRRVTSAPAAKSKAVAKTGKPAGRKKAVCEVPEPEFTERELSDEDVSTLVSAILSDDIPNGLCSSNWKDRLASAEKFFEAIQQIEKTEIPAQALVKLLVKKPGLKENNFQILKLKFEILTFISDNAPISHCTVESCLNDVVDKIGDVKTGSTACAVLSSLASATSLEYISLEVLNAAFAQRNPRNQTESLIWLSSAIKQFGLRVQLKEVIDCLKKAFSSTNPTVKNAALTLVGTLFMYVGKTLRSFFEDEKPALLQLIDSEFEKMKDLQPPLPQRGLKQSASADGSVDGSKAHVPVNVSELFPRVDVSGQISSQILTDLADKDWHLRLDALQAVSNIISDAKFITPNLGDLPNVLKPRLTDTNKKLALQALSVCQMLGSALGSHSSKQLRNFSSGILAALGDSKANVRAGALQCLNTWMENCHLSNLFEGETVFEALRTDNPFLRTELFSWLTTKLPAATTAPVQDLNQCIPLLFNCLEDRNVDVRKKASDCIAPFMMHVGYDAMVRVASKLKPASKANVVSQLDKVRPSIPEKPSAKPKQGKTAPNASRGSPPSPGDGEESGIPSGIGKGKLNRCASKSKLALKAPSAPGKAKKEEEMDTSPPLVCNNLKDQRIADEKALKVLRWNFTTPREEFYLQLKDQMTTANWGRILITHCFHNDFKFHIKTIDILIECLGSSLDATIANLDLILKWIALRFFDTNPSVLLKALEYLQMLFDDLICQRYRLLDAEATSFVPYLILKIGDPKDPVRKGVKEIIKLLCRVYPSSKMFANIMQGLSSKNARQRAECLEELGILIETCGLSVCQPSPAVALKEIARQISDRDNSVRNASLNCVVQAYFIEGEKVYKYVGTLADKDMSYLEERIKRCSKNRTVGKPNDPLQENIPPTHSTRISPPMQASQKHTSEENERRFVKSTPQRPRSKGPFTLDLDDFEMMFKSKENEANLPAPIPVNADEILNLPDIKLPQTRLRPPASAVKLLNNSPEANSAINLVMSQLTAQEIPVVVEAFAQVEELLRQEDRAEAVIGPRVDQLLVMSALQYRLVYNKHMSDENVCKADVIKVYRCLNMALVSLFDNTLLAKKASRDVLRELIPQLITVLLDNRLNELQEGPQVIRTINVLIIRIISNSDPTNVMSSLIKLLHDSIGNMTGNERYTDLVMKCLWKMIRLIKHVIDELKVDRILLDLHVFLKTYPSSSWKERPADIPIRTIKTVLYTLVDVMGEDIMKYMKQIPNKQESDLYPYLQKLLKIKKDKGGRSRGESDENIVGKETHKKSRTSLKLSKSTHEALTEIFKKIGSKEQTKDGLLELYEFINCHPEANIEPFLQRSSDFFQNYIHQGIKQIEAERKGIESSETVHSNIISPDVVPKNEPQNNWDIDSEFYKESMENEKGSNEAWREIFPPMPPPTAETTPMDWGEWFKLVLARMGLDTSKYNDPELMKSILRVGPDNEEPYNEQQIADMMAELERLKSRVIDMKNTVNV